MSHYDLARVTVGHRPTSFTVYGKSFPFPSRDHADHFKLRDEALRDAKAYGAELLSKMVAQKGGPLSVREELTAQLDAGPDVRPIRERVRADAIVTTAPAADPNVSPYAGRLAELRSQNPATAGQRMQRDRRLAIIEASHAEWTAKHERKVATEARDLEPLVVNARAHADSVLRFFKRDATATPAEVLERERLFHLAHDDSTPPQSYWDQSRLAEESWHQRLDSVAAAKHESALEARRDHAAAKSAAETAREPMVAV